MLHGRAAELAEVHGHLAEARGGRSSLLVVQGEAGCGKTALLEQAAADAHDFRVLRCTGVESEAELPFAALHLLLHDIAATALVDVGNTLRAKYGVDRQTMPLIRPDGYLALRHGVLRSALQQWLQPVRSTLVEEK
jgi:hypothetical protein